MKRIQLNRNKQFVMVSEFGEERIHLIHCADSIEELQEDVANIYVVAEEATNFARLHLVTDFSEDEALQQVATYLYEEEEEEEAHLIHVQEVTL